MANRRFASRVPAFSSIFTPRQAALLDEFARTLFDGFKGAVKEHAGEHRPGKRDELPTAAPRTLALGNSTGTPAKGTQLAFAQADHDHGTIKRDVRIYTDGNEVGTRNALELIAGPNISLTPVDDGGGDRVKVTINGPTSDTVELDSGIATLVAGTVVVPNLGVTNGSIILLTCQIPGGTPGFVYISAKTPGTSFAITSSNVADTSTIGWVRIEPSPVLWFSADGTPFYQRAA